MIKAVKSTYLVGRTGPTIADYTKFENVEVKTSKPSPWVQSKNYNSYELSEEELSLFESWETVAYVIIQNDSLLFEKYWDSYNEQSYSNSFSVAKSLVSLAIGAAIQKGCIESINQKVSDFLPEFRTKEKSSIRIKDLLSMSSGLDFGESYGDPFGFMAKTYYGDEIYELTMSKDVKYSAGEVWKYQGGNTLLLSFLLKKACGSSLSDFFSTNIWQKLNASENALWTVSSGDKLEKSYCCFYSNAKDYARIGQLMLDSGKWNGKQLIDPSFVKEVFSPVNIKNEKQKLIDYYALHWWLMQYEGTKVMYARGILGQYIVMIPDWNMVVVRLGHKRDPVADVAVPIDLYDYLKIAKAIRSN